MAEVLRMPKLGLSMQKGSVVKWLYNEGEQVEKDEPIVEIETEKIVNEVESPISGILLKIYVKEGDTVPILTPLGVIGKLGEKIDNEKKITTETVLTTKGKEKLNTDNEIKCDLGLKRSEKNDLKASPLAMKYAAKVGVNLNDIRGTGPGGRIMKKDIENYLKENRTILPKDKIEEIPSTEKKLCSESKQFKEVIPYTGMRKIIGDRLSQSKFTAPHIYLTISVDMTKVQELIEMFRKKTQMKITINDFMVFVVAKVLSEEPKINCSLINEEIIYHKDINVGVAVALEEGLIVPVVRNADKKDLLTISKELKDLIRLSRERKIMPDDYKGGTFTVSNIGMYGIEQSTAIINPPEAAILSVSKIIRKPIVVNNENDKIEIRSIMKMTLSVDHRLIDGAMAAKFLSQLKYYLEFPEALILF